VKETYNRLMQLMSNSVQPKVEQTNYLHAGSRNQSSGLLKCQTAVLKESQTHIPKHQKQPLSRNYGQVPNVTAASMNKSSSLH